jgi:hypothetical protein
MGNWGIMKKRFLVQILAGILAVSLTTPASAATSKIELKSFATVTYNNTVKLKTSGCQKLTFNYQLKKASAKSVYLWVEVNNADGQLVGYGDRAQNSTRIGKFSVKICRNEWLDPELVNDDPDYGDLFDGRILGAKKGKLEVVVSFLDTSSFGTDTKYSYITLK